MARIEMTLRADSVADLMDQMEAFLLLEGQVEVPVDKDVLGTAPGTEAKQGPQTPVSPPETNQEPVTDTAKAAAESQVQPDKPKRGPGRPTKAEKEAKEKAELAAKMKAAEDANKTPQDRFKSPEDAYNAAIDLMLKAYEADYKRDAITAIPAEFGKATAAEIDKDKGYELLAKAETLLEGFNATVH